VTEARGRAARALLDGALGVLLLALGVQLAVAAVHRARRQEQVGEVGKEAKALYAALQSYRERNGAYPDTHGNPPFEPATLEPLCRRGYYQGSIGRYLRDGRIDAYDAPDDQGPNREFWMEMTLASDPGVRLVIARSDDAPSGGGIWLDGVFVVRDGALERL
jgi:type II secretory pathway pseudopilin PulG